MKLCLTVKTENDKYTEIILSDILEFVAGFEYFYIRFNEHYVGPTNTMSYLRSKLMNIERMYPDGTKKKVHLKQVPKDRKYENS